MIRFKLPEPARSRERQRPGQAKRTGRPARTIRKVAGGGVLVLLWVLFCIVFYQNLPEHFLNQVATAGSSGMAPEEFSTASPVDRFIRIGMLLISLSVFAARWSTLRTLLKNINPGFAAFMVAAPLSAIWSIDATATLLRFTTFSCIALMCLAIALMGWDRLRLQHVAIFPVMAILVVSLALGIVYPDRIIEIGTDISQNDAWHGITFTKNSFGMMASVGMVICTHQWLAREGRTLWYIAGTAVAFTCLLLSRSSTSILAATAGTLFLVLMMRVPAVKRQYSTHVVITFAVVLVLYELVIQDVLPGVNTLLSPIAKLTGKDLTFSSRTGIWEIIKEHMRYAPYLGSGYGAYWTGPFPGSPSYVFTWRMYFYPAESHNGYLEVMNDLGYLGLACLVAFLFWYVRQSLQLMRFDRAQSILYLALLFQDMVINMSESNWFTRSSTFTVLILASFCLSRGLSEHRQDRGRQARLAPPQQARH